MAKNIITLFLLLSIGSCVASSAGAGSQIEPDRVQVFITKALAAAQKMMDAKNYGEAAQVFAGLASRTDLTSDQLQSLFSAAADIMSFRTYYLAAQVVAAKVFAALAGRTGLTNAQLSSLFSAAQQMIREGWISAPQVFAALAGRTDLTGAQRAVVRDVAQKMMKSDNLFDEYWRAAHFFAVLARRTDLTGAQLSSLFGAAQKMMDAKNYGEAAQVFAGLASRTDLTSDQRALVRDAAQEMMSAKRYESAAQIFKNIPILLSPENQESLMCHLGKEGVVEALLARINYEQESRGLAELAFVSKDDAKIKHVESSKPWGRVRAAVFRRDSEFQKIIAQFLGLRSIRPAALAPLGMVPDAASAITAPAPIPVSALPTPPAALGVSTLPLK